VAIAGTTPEPTPAGAASPAGATAAREGVGPHERRRGVNLEHARNVFLATVPFLVFCLEILKRFGGFVDKILEYM
jgi:hypothetical protein